MPKTKTQHQPRPKNTQPQNHAWLRAPLDDLYASLSRPEFIAPDPLELVVSYPHVADREIAGLIAACLAFGNVKQIVRNAGAVLTRMREPAAFLRNESPQSIERAFVGFQHRYADARSLARLLAGARRALIEFGSIGDCFAACTRSEDDSVLSPLTRLIAFMDDGAGRNCLLPRPELGSACKRLHLYLRWMVRNDAVDPGGWKHVDPKMLVVPLDTHMRQMAVALGLTRRRDAGLRTALEITQAFRQIAPEDPVRYDFCLTRLGIRNELSPESFIAACHSAKPRRR